MSLTFTQLYDAVGARLLSETLGYHQKYMEQVRRGAKPLTLEIARRCHAAFGDTFNVDHHLRELLDGAEAEQAPIDTLTAPTPPEAA